MSTYTEIKEIPERFKSHRDKLLKLLKQYDITSMRGLRHVYKTDKQFHEKWQSIWTEIAKVDGGKLSLTTIGIIIGSVLGGVGIAAMGGAIGIPLALVLGLSGFLVGTKFDDTKILTSEKSISVTLPNTLVDKLSEDADKIGCSVNELVEILIKQVYNIE